MNLNTLTPEQWTLIISACAGLLVAMGYVIRSQAKARFLDAEARARVAIINAENEKVEIATDSELTRKITDEILKRGNENSDLNRFLRECEVRNKENEGLIKELRKMVADLGERNATQADMMRQLAMVDARKQQLIDLQQTKIQTLEYQLAYNLDLDPNKDKNILTSEDDKPKDNEP